MKVIAIKCPNCGAPLDNIDGAAECGFCAVKCDYCRTVSSIVLDEPRAEKAQATSNTDWAEDLINGLLEGNYYDEE